MDVSLDPTVAEGYSSKSQQSRVVTESWAEENLYCLACDSKRLLSHRPNKRVEDFYCPLCDRRVQLKATRGRHEKTVAGAAYEPTIEAIRAGELPDHAFMEFDSDAWTVLELFVIPGHLMTPSVVERRNPLRSSARRSGWVGSTIRLDRIPAAGRIPVVADGEVVPSDSVRERFQRTAFLANEKHERRDWTTAVLGCIEDLPVQQGQRFELADVYAFEDRLAEQFPDNQHVRAKIRQQLQVLRDEGLLTFLGDGEYRMHWVDDRNPF